MNKSKLIIILAEIVVWILFSLFLLGIDSAYAIYEDGTEPVLTEYKSQESADFLWEELSKYSPNDMITAGVMGYFWHESFLRSDGIAGWPMFDISQGCNSSLAFTTKVDEGLHDGSSYEYFKHCVRDIYGGYGLGQWLSEHYLEHFYEFVREREGSIGDARLQCEFIFESMQRHEKLWNMLMEAKTPFDCGMAIAVWYDGSSMPGAIASHAERYYEEYVLNGSN